MNAASLMSKVIFTTKKYKPEIKFVFGVISMGAALVCTHKAALKCQKIKEEREQGLCDIEETVEMVKKGELAEDQYTEADVKNDRRIVNVKYGIDMVKNYALPAGFAIASVALFHGAMTDYKDLFVGVSAAYTALRTKFDDKMSFFKKELGEEKFQELEDGFKSEQIKESQNTGLTDPKEKEEARNKCNPYSRWFDELHGCWTDDPEVNKNWLLGKQNWLNSRLQRNGFLFLNDAYEEMGYPPTDAGRVMGWLAKKPDGTINSIDFGIFNIHDEASRWFVNGLEPVFLIDFNVDPKPITGRIGWAKY